MIFAQETMTGEIIVDNFAGGGGASTGIEIATGRAVAIAINHDPAAILMHRTNHPYTEHLQASVWDVDPKSVCRGRPVGLAWFSPDCKHFSKAKGAALVDRKIRGLAWITLRWAAEVRPRVIILENVEEFQTWGPVRKGKPVKKLAGTTFRKFIDQVVKFKGDNLGHGMKEPMQTVTTSAGEFAVCKVFLAKMCGGDDLGHWAEIRALLNEFCDYELAEDEVLLLEISRTLYYIADIGLRMLSPRELYNAMGFPPDYIIDRDYEGNEYKKSAQVARCGNAVCPPVASALVRANLPEWCGVTITTM